jgi:hypothetical protein
VSSPLSLDEYFEGSALCHLLPNHAPDVAARLGGAYGLAAAALFGMSPPIAKLLLPEADPTPFRRTPVWWSWPRVAWL